MDSVWSQWKRVLLKLKFRRYPIFPGIIVLIFVFLAIFGEFLAPHPPTEVNLGARFVPPYWQAGGKMAYPLGTDMLGRDMLSRIMAGAKVSFIVSVLALTLGGLVGTILGIISGYYGGRVDTILMRAADATLAFPIILLAILLSIILGPSLQNVVISLGIVLWARYARVIRGEVLSFKERDFVALARVAGASDLRIMFLHLFPNIRSTLLVLLTLQVGWVIVVEASLSFIGAGIPGPTPVWGSMIAKGREYVTMAWWIPFFPGLAVAVVCLSFNMLGDWLREALDPKLRQVIGGG
jgi:peptide/nickel transport system permease protein